MPEMLIGGEWRHATAHEELPVVSPATEDTVDSVPAGTPEDVELAVATAKRAFTGAGQDAARRADRAHQGDRYADALRRPLEGAPRRAHAEPRPRRRRRRATPTTRRRGGDRPLELPTTLLSNKLAPALVAGDTVVAKPAGTTPLTTLRFAELLAEGGLPPGVFNVITGSGSVTGNALVRHPNVRKIASPARLRSVSGSWRSPRGV